MSNRLQKLITHFLLAAILVNAVGAASASVFQNSVLLCTSQGYEWVNVEEENNSSSVMSHCDICITASSDEDDSEDELFYIFDSFIHLQNKISTEVFLNRVNSQYLTAQGRAPPFTSLFY